MQQRQRLPANCDSKHRQAPPCSFGSMEEAAALPERHGKGSSTSCPNLVAPPCRRAALCRCASMLGGAPPLCLVARDAVIIHVSTMPPSHHEERATPLACPDSPRSGWAPIEVLLPARPRAAATAAISVAARPVGPPESESHG